ATPAAAQGINEELAAFDDCPLEVAGVEACVHSVITGGQFHLGSKTVTIENPLVLQGGLAQGFELIPAKDGETLSKSPQVVPGGLTGFGIGGLNEVTATAELAGTVLTNSTALFGQEGTAVTLPLRVKLDNAVLGNSCFVGSSAEPVTL